MPTALRTSEIMSLLRRDGQVGAEQLARHFAVTVQTIRRDLNELAREGLVSRVHGGAVLPSGTRNIGYAERRSLGEDAKSRIGRAAAERIPNGASVFLDIGTTSEAVARALLGHSGLMVVTNNIHVANILAESPDTDVLLAGGLLRRTDGGLVGEVTADFVRQFKVDVAVLGASAIDQAGDALDFDFREVRVAQAVMDKARRAMLVADRSKLARTAPVAIAPVAEFDLWITDAPPPPELTRRCVEGGCEIVVAERSTRK